MRWLKHLCCFLGFLHLAPVEGYGQSPPADSFNRTRIASPFVLTEGTNQPVFEFADVSDETASPASLKDGIEWEIVINENMRMIRIGSDAADLPGISIGSGDQEIQVKAKDNAPLKQDHVQGTILFKVVDAAGLRRKHRAGIYQGTIQVRIDPRRTDGGIKWLPIKLTLVIPGRALVDLNFANARGQTLKVGDACSVNLNVEDYYLENSPAPSLEDSPGVLELPWESDDPTSPKVLAKRPIPSPKDERARLARPDEVWAWETSEPILPTRVQSEKPEKIGTSGYVCRKTKILVPLPDLVRTGEIKGTLTWGSSKLELPKTKIRAGILRVGRMGYVGENLGLVAIFSEKTPGIESWGEVLELNVTGADGYQSKVTLKQERRNGFVRYEGNFEIPSRGKFSVGFDAGLNPVQAALIPSAIDVWVPLEISSQFPEKPSDEEEAEPLLLFQAARPLIYFYQHVSSICHLQRSALDLTLKDGSPMRLRLEGIYKQGSNFREPLTSADPTLIAIDEDTIRSEDTKVLSAIEQDTNGWDVSAPSTKKIALVAHIHENTGILPENRKLDVTPLVLRWLIEGVDSNGDPVARFYDQDIRVRVASQTELEFLWVWFAAFFAAILFLGFVWFLVHTSRSARNPSHKITLPSLEDDLASQSRPDPEADADFDHPDSNSSDHQPPNRKSKAQDEDQSSPDTFGMEDSDD